MKTVYQIIIFSVFFTSCKEEKYKYDISDFRTELKPSLKSLSKEKSLPSTDTIARNFIEKNATKEELIKLMDSKSPLLRVIAYRTIVNKEEPEYFDLLTKHLSDTAKVTWWYYEDAGDNFYVSDLMIRKAHDKNGLSPIQKKYLVEKILLEHPYLETSTWMIHDINPNEKYYNLIKKIAGLKSDECGKQLSACFALSKFKKKEDVNVLYDVFNQNIKNEYCVKWIFRSIEKYPNDKFFPILEDYFNQKIKGKLSLEENIFDDVLYFSRAVAAYKNENALTILKYIEQNNTYINKPAWPPSNKKYVYKAMVINYDKIYDDLIKQIQSEFKKEDLEKLGFGRQLLEYDEESNW
ncbi:hypothetical protein [Chryseobacterium wangxinyae]|uniref:hypothetical protein n=1 Tax=Chryseobacterium sp. CY353 TaxID=2997334 RepID=UPI00226F38CA|nr:hypothetical protein [Chryseobacterium sp. CY353]MCY0969862.1 hypothetical protein [Chryseobacterium sp. CY353]